MLYLAVRQSVPEQLKENEWHLPFVRKQEKEGFLYRPDLQWVRPENAPDLIQFSAARCAWVSYENHNREGTAEVMKNTFQRLVGSTPVHASPTEHQATPEMKSCTALQRERWRSNLRGWIQARKLLPREECRNYQPSDAEIASWGLQQPRPDADVQGE
jgi:hypothetical protein